MNQNALIVRGNLVELKITIKNCGKDININFNLKSFDQKRVLSLAGESSVGERTLLATSGSNQFFLSPTARFCCWDSKF